MNAQNSDSFSPEISPPLPEGPKTPVVTTKEHKGALDILAGFFHKKSPEPGEKSPILSPTPSVPTPESPQNPLPKAPHLTIKEQIAHIFHKKAPSQTIKNVDISGVSPEGVHTETPAVKGAEPETPFVMDEKFARLLKHDTTYHSMIRSEDIKNIQLQLSMRYMLLMLAIFVVIAWVVNNRVIMFGFSDFPLLARTRDGLFAILTGLFCLTVWFGSGVWFSHRIGALTLRIISGLLFAVVIVSIYLPFWR